VFAGRCEEPRSSGFGSRLYVLELAVARLTTVVLGFEDYFEDGFLELMVGFEWSRRKCMRLLGILIGMVVFRRTLHVKDFIL